MLSIANDPCNINTIISALASIITKSSGLPLELDIYYVADDDINKMLVTYTNQ